MRCPKCSREGIKTLNSVARPERWLVRRRRYCGHCKKEFVTFEILEAEFQKLEKKQSVLQGLGEFLGEAKAKD